jgi:hypothetical protein
MGRLARLVDSAGADWRGIDTLYVTGHGRIYYGNFPEPRSIDAPISLTSWDSRWILAESDRELRGFDNGEPGRVAGSRPADTLAAR